MAATAPADLPEAAVRRFAEGAFTSGLTVPDFAACLQMGLEPVGFVQGFCVMQWQWYGMGGDRAGHGRLRAPVRPDTGGYSENWQCPHGMVSAEHRAWGQNYEQTWVEDAWTEGFTTAYDRMVEEAASAGAHGVVGVVDTSQPLADMGVLEFQVQGTAVRVTDGVPPADGRPWTTYLAGQRLAKLVEAGYAPVSIVASVASVRVWANCITEYLTEGSNSMYSMAQPGRPRSTRRSRPTSAVRRLARRAGPGPARTTTRCTARPWPPPSASSARATPSSSASCGATGSAGSRTSTRCPPPVPTVRLL